MKFKEFLGVIAAIVLAIITLMGMFSLEIYVGLSLLAISLCVVIVVYFVKFVNNIRRQMCNKKIEKIKKDYPLAYEDYTIMINFEKIEDLKKIIKRPVYIWQEEENKIKEYKKKYEKILKIYPDGVDFWKKTNTGFSYKKVIDDEALIKKYDEDIKRKIEDEKIKSEMEKTARMYDDWEREQREFSNQCDSSSKKTLSAFEKCKYAIPFKKIDAMGKKVDGNYDVWQFFQIPYCSQKNIDYTNVESIRQNTENIKKFKNKEMCCGSHIYESIKKFVEELGKKYDLSIYLCVNGFEKDDNWSIQCLKYHYLDVKGTPFLTLPNNIEVCDVDALKKGIICTDFPILKNRHIIIFDMQTENIKLENVCKNIIEKNQEKCPLITYVSLLKGYDRYEIQNIITKENRNKWCDFVDLGLPSNSRWAKCNIGADTPDDNGDSYSWDNVLSKKKKEKWRVPTKEEFVELENVCKWERIEMNNNVGYNVIGPNGNSIFLPLCTYLCSTQNDVFDLNLPKNIRMQNCYHPSKCSIRLILVDYTY